MKAYNLGRQEFGDPQNTGKLPTRQEALELLGQWVPNPKLRLHMAQVGALMKAWAEKQGLSDQEILLWELTGLLHDADWERWPQEHCRRIVEYLEEKEYDPRLIRGIASHGPRHFGVEPQSDLEKMVYAFDELSGFIHAVSLVRPEGYTGMKAKSVKKKLKDKSFAAQVNREDIADALERLGISIDELLGFMIPLQAQVTL
jgi:predicted hydrolase (HD superfamily)